MRSPVERLEEWCDKRFAELKDMEPVPSDFDVAHDSRDGRLVAAYRQIIADYRVLCEEGGNELALTQLGLGDGARLQEVESEATGLVLAITRIADAVNPEEPDA